MAGNKALAALALPFAILSFCAWCVYVGGLAAVQQRCGTEPNFFQNQQYNGSSCGHVFSYWWFVMAINFVTILAVIAMCASGGVAWTRLALLGMVTVCFILYIQASYWFTNILWTTPAYDNMDQPDHRMRTLVAGAIMTATFNGLLLICLGIVDPRRELYNANSQAKAMTGNNDTYGTHVPGTGAHVPGTGTHIPGTGAHTTNVV